MALRRLYHQKEERIEAYIFVAFLAYCLHVTLHRWVRDLAPGLTLLSPQAGRYLLGLAHDAQQV